MQNVAFNAKKNIMNKIYFLLLTFLLAISCNLKDRKLTQNEIDTLVKEHNDSVTIVLDSLYKLNISIPPLYNQIILDSTTISKFFELANSTDGELKLLVNSKLVTNEIINIIDAYSTENADILLLIDKTSSMQDDIDNVKQSLGQIISALSTKKNTRLGIGLYGDKNADGTAWYSFHNFESDLSKAKEFINSIQVTGGGDYPESVYDGFFQITKENFWKSENKRMVILIGDAYPLENPNSDYTINDVIRKATEYKIKMNFYPIVVSPHSFFIDKLQLEDRKFISTKLIHNIYPNPCFADLKVEFVTSDSYAIEIYDSNGKIIIRENTTNTKWQKNIQAFKDGAYILRVLNSKNMFETSKFIIYKR